MSSGWVKFHADYYLGGAARDLPRSARFVALEIDHRIRVEGEIDSDGTGRLRIPSHGTPAQALHEVLGGSRQEIVSALPRLVAAGWLEVQEGSEPEGHQGSRQKGTRGPGKRAVAVPSWGERNKVDESRERSARYRAKKKGSAENVTRDGDDYDRDANGDDTLLERERERERSPSENVESESESETLAPPAHPSVGIRDESSEGGEGAGDAPENGNPLDALAETVEVLVRSPFVYAPREIAERLVAAFAALTHTTAAEAARIARLDVEARKGDGSGRLIELRALDFRDPVAFEAALKRFDPSAWKARKLVAGLTKRAENDAREAARAEAAKRDEHAARLAKARERYRDGPDALVLARLELDEALDAQAGDLGHHALALAFDRRSFLVKLDSIAMAIEKRSARIERLCTEFGIAPPPPIVDSPENAAKWSEIAASYSLPPGGIGAVPPHERIALGRACIAALEPPTNVRPLRRAGAAE